jgi:hypothetical protein
VRGANPWARGHSADVGKHEVTKLPADTACPRTGDVGAVPYVGASGQTHGIEGMQLDTKAAAADLLELNRDLRGSRAIRLLATTNLSLYATLMERHLSDGTVPETELVVRLERDLSDLDDPQSGLALI